MAILIKEIEFEEILNQINSAKQAFCIDLEDPPEQEEGFKVNEWDESVCGPSDWSTTEKTTIQREEINRIRAMYGLGGIKE